MSVGIPGQTLLLDLTNWDLVIDSLGNIAVVIASLCPRAGSVACAAKTFLDEVWYDSTVGVPYLQSILGKRPSPGFVQAQLVKAALSVPGVVTAECILSGFINTTPPAAQSGGYVVDSSGNIITDSSGNPITDSSGSVSAAASATVNARQLSGQILFVDVNGVAGGVTL